VDGDEVVVHVVKRHGISVILDRRQGPENSNCTTGERLYVLTHGGVGATIVLKVR
jgi:hypothetical protein